MYGNTAPKFVLFIEGKDIMENRENDLIKWAASAYNKITINDYDYIFGDYSYDKLRLKGYYDSKNKKAKTINDIKYLKEYKEKYCNFGAKTFLIKKIK